MALTKGRVGDPSAVQFVGAVGAVVPAITHGLQRPALTISAGELRGAAGLCKMRGASMAGHGLGYGHRQRAGWPWLGLCRWRVASLLGVSLFPC